MEKLLTDYLYKNKNCPLPSVGTLIIQPGHASYIPGESRIIAPVPFIDLIEKETISHDLIEFISEKEMINANEAASLLNSFSGRLKILQPGEEFILSSDGSFYKDENDILHFKHTPLPASFFPDAPAQRVIHPDTPHQMLVGDTETNSATMTEILNQETIGKRKWGIAAFVFAILGATIILIYFINTDSRSFGNTNPVIPVQESKTYSTGNK